MARREPGGTEARPDVPGQREAGGRSPAGASPRMGVRPIQTNWFDRLFIGMVIWVAASLLWFRFVEPLGPSIWISNAIVAALAAVIIWKG